MKFHCVLAALLWMAGRILAVEEVPYAIAKEPWADGLGNHRAGLHVEQKADAVVARIPWRRRDRDPERKDIIVLDAATGLRVTNVARISDDRFEGVLAFQPQTVPGDYFVYYLPYPPEKGWGSYTLDYFKPQDKADPAWKATVAQASAPAGGEAARLASPTNAGGTPPLRTLPAARLLRLEARTEFDSFYPMEVVATPEEVQAMLVGQASRLSLANGEPETGVTPFLLFPEDRRFPIRMKDELPLRWVKSGPTNVFRGEAQRNEFYVFQIGVWAAQTNLAGLDVEFSGEIAKWLRCVNTGGTNWDGQPFHKTLTVPQGRVQALWFGVDVPPDAKPGEHRATVTVRPTNAPASSVELVLTVLPTELADRGDGDLWRLARLRWLDSMMGSDAEGLGPCPLVAAEVRRAGIPQLLASGQTRWVTNEALQSIRVQESEVRFGPGQSLQMPSSIQVGNAEELLAAPVRVFVESSAGHPLLHTPEASQRIHLQAPGVLRSEAFATLGQLEMRNLMTAEADGTLRFRLELLDCSESLSVSNLAVVLPLRGELACYFMGLGRRASRRPRTSPGTGPAPTTASGSATRRPACT